MLQHYQDAMSMVRKFSKPDLFITMTCNPKWREITENLLPGQSASDRPDLTARVFDIKEDALVKTIGKEQLFGEVLAYNWVIEFQKRGLPHLHMLITLKNNSKIKTPDSVDKFISAEIPNPHDNPILHEIVTRNMLHGPCGDWCLIDGICSKRFPKDIRNETTMDDNGYPSYRRRDEGITFSRNNSVFDNRHVVPYNPTLIQIFDCHINVEVVCSVTAVKYLFKYVYKGHDKAGVTISGNIPSELDPQEQTTHETISNPNDNVINHDEVKNFVDARYDGPVEPAWRIFSKKLQDKSHSIVRLPVHLPNQQSITINDDCNEQDLLAALQRQSMLIDYFSLNVLKSFEDLRTVNGIIYETYMSACLAAGLIEDDQEWRRTLHEAVTWMMPRQLRCLFARILIHCQPTDPESLWNEFKEAMSEDFNRQVGVERGQKKAYAYINNMIEREGCSLSSFPGMPPVENDLCDNESVQILTQDLSQSYYNKLNINQKEIVDFVLNSVENNATNLPNCIYIDGPGGSGIAATLLPNGKTVHRTFGLPVPMFSDSSSHIKPNSQQGKYLKTVDVFIWDEAPMSPSGTLNNLDDIMDLPDECFTSNNNDIVENVYGRIIRGKRYDELTTTVILSARNIDVDFINTQVVELLDFSTEHIYIGVDSTENCDNENFDDAILPEYLNTLNPPNFPPYELKLRQYSIVMLIRNLNLSEGLCNGTRLIILELGVHVLKCKILTGDKAGEIVFINRTTIPN
ncbi:uncharacterized protein LOC123272196 [Cotesia glomerata]|uniref:uncharacterized protein LOC123272196 n=1 Tax=Cotesia glomerata TaxID=32391 RepID=UPI001D00B4B7|nr:uncharacterized protein LOC123272196 [Cotesia glomerata]